MSQNSITVLMTQSTDEKLVPVILYDSDYLCHRFKYQILKTFNIKEYESPHEIVEGNIIYVYIYNNYMNIVYDYTIRLELIDGSEQGHEFIKMIEDTGYIREISL